MEKGIDMDNAEMILQEILKTKGWYNFARQKEDLRIRLEKQRQGIYYEYQNHSSNRF